MNAIERLRIEQLIGTDETRGVRGDLARARNTKAAGYRTWVDGRPIEMAIVSYERTMAVYQEMLAR